MPSEMTNEELAEYIGDTNCECGFCKCLKEAAKRLREQFERINELNNELQEIMNKVEHYERFGNIL